jgi:hypothetical protein
LSDDPTVEPIGLGEDPQRPGEAPHGDGLSDDNGNTFGQRQLFLSLTTIRTFFFISLISKS